jgi:hypothetical protein
MTTAIRAQDPTHLLFPEPYVLFNFGTAPTNITLPGGDANSGLSWHMYTLDVAKEPSVISNANAWAAKTGGALLNTEFGATSDPVAINRQIGELDDALEPWIWWAYGEEITKDLHQAPTEDNLNQPAVNAIVRPHPVAVAGTPTALHYDTSAKALTFSYRTTRAGGGSFACGTVTSLQVPLRSYPSRPISPSSRSRGPRAWPWPCGPAARPLPRAPLRCAPPRPAPRPPAVAPTPPWRRHPPRPCRPSPPSPADPGRHAQNFWGRCGSGGA